MIVLAPEHVVSLGKKHDRESFDCGSEPLNRYLKQQARQDLDKRVAAPFVLVEPGKNVVRGYYTLSASIISLNDLPESQKKKLPRYAQLPVTLIGRLARDKSINIKGVGEFLLMDALRRSLEHAAQIAAMAVVVDAKDDVAESFYSHFDFLPFQQTPRRMFLPMHQIATLFA